MSKRETLTRYGLIVKRLRKAPASQQDIIEYLERHAELHGYGHNISARTFRRDLSDIRSIYNLDIQYNRSEKLYFLDSEDAL